MRDGRSVIASASPRGADESAGGALEDAIKAQALGLGFDLVGITATGPAETAEHFQAWLDAGHAGTMSYLERNADARRDSRRPFTGGASAIVVGLDYGGTEPAGPVARYARGDDYHEVMWRKLDVLREWIDQRAGRTVRGRGFVDTGPLLERDLARRAGLGWFGKNTNLINPGRGSFFFLGALIVDLPLRADPPFEADRCGSCTRCLDACPTQAFAAPRVLDATRCISYLTIELRESIPVDLREAMGELIYGCDVCQDVCPWNVRFATAAREEAFRPRAMLAGADARTIALDLLSMDDARYRASFSGSPMKRARRRGLARNAAVVLGNIGDRRDVPALTRALEDPEPVVREHAQWALDRIAKVR
jgi:epoxyqueuosine reductase